MDFLQDIATVFQRAGEEIFLVGGTVRDRLLGRRSPDLDLATTARPAQIARLLNQAGADAVVDIGSAYGDHHGTVR